MANVKCESEVTMEPNKGGTPDEVVNIVQARGALPIVYNSEGAGRAIGVSRSTIANWVMAGVMAPQYMESTTRRFLFSEDEVSRMRKLREEAQGGS
jgi:hypothetical protein